jgi:hypothetical protein
MRQETTVTGTAAGVPFLAVPPDGGPGLAPVVVAWHLMDPPRTEAAFAAALPLAGLDAWRIYLGLPMCGARLPAGGFEELMRLGYEDAVLNLQGPIAAEDDPAGFLDPARQLTTALAGRYADPTRVDVVTVPGMGHALAEEPGIEPAPQTPHAALVDRFAVDWLATHLQTPRAGGAGEVAR